MNALSLFLLTKFGYSSSSTKMEVKRMTSQQIKEEKGVIFKSAIALLQSRGYYIEETDEVIGCIRASKRIDGENILKAIGRKLVNEPKEEKTSKVCFYIDELNPNLSEVIINLYKIPEKDHIYNRRNKINSTKGMIYKNKRYWNWFYELKRSIEKRKSIEE